MKFYDRDMRETFGETLIELGERYPEMIVLDADLNTSTGTAGFLEKYPGRFVQCGIAEANMFGVAAGLASVGFTPFPTTFAAFVHRKALDSVYMNICCQNLNVKIAGSYPGVTAAQCGPSHNTAEDIAVMRSLPGMRVALPGDNAELKSVMRQMMEYRGPVYFRVPRVKAPALFGEDHAFEWGKGYLLREGKDISLIGTGMLTGVCLEAARMLARRGIDAEVVHMAWAKPVDEALLLRTARKTGTVITIENGRVYGGFGSAVTEALSADCSVRIGRMGLGDENFGSAPMLRLLREAKLTPADMAENARKMLAVR